VSEYPHPELGPHVRRELEALGNAVFFDVRSDDGEGDCESGDGIGTLPVLRASVMDRPDSGPDMAALQGQTGRSQRHDADGFTGQMLRRRARGRRANWSTTASLTSLCVTHLRRHFRIAESVR